METNILKALNTISQLNTFALNQLYIGQNRMNNVGDALEYFVRDILCSSLSVESLADKDLAHSHFLSYIGNQNNPPDFIIKGGDAVEVKKISNASGGLQLNSSYPKSKLYADDTRITDICKNVDNGNWNQKDIIYAVGAVAGDKITNLWFVYGDCYAADRKIYQKVSDTVSEKISEAGDLDLNIETNEIAQIRRVDPLGITYLRIRGMWGIESPQRVFGSLVTSDHDSQFSAHALMPTEKYRSFPESDRREIEANRLLVIKAVEVKSPDNPAVYIQATLISFLK